MARVNVFMAEDLLDAVDAEAKRQKLNRSALVQTALSEFLDTRRRAREEREAQTRRDEACAKMDRLAEKLGEWDTVGVTREQRFRRAHRFAAVGEKRSRYQTGREKKRR